VAAQEMIAILPKRALKVKALVDEVAVLWENPAERLSNVASTDITLMDELNGVGTCTIDWHIYVPNLAVLTLISCWCRVFYRRGEPAPGGRQHECVQRGHAAEHLLAQLRALRQQPLLHQVSPYPARDCSVFVPVALCTIS
jgi:hypothetical protein